MDSAKAGIDSLFFNNKISQTTDSKRPSGPANSGQTFGMLYENHLSFLFFLQKTLTYCRQIPSCIYRFPLEVFIADLKFLAPAHSSVFSMSWQLVS